MMSTATAFTNATDNSKPPWPDDLKNPAAGQVNAFFRWKNVSDTSAYIQAIATGGDATDFRETLDDQTKQAEITAFSLRTNRGISGLPTEKAAEFARLGHQLGAAV